VTSVKSVENIFSLVVPPVNCLIHLVNKAAYKNSYICVSTVSASTAAVTVSTLAPSTADPPPLRFHAKSHRKASAKVSFEGVLSLKVFFAVCLFCPPSASV